MDLRHDGTRAYKYFTTASMIFCVPS